MDYSTRPSAFGVRYLEYIVDFLYLSAQLRSRSIFKLSNKFGQRYDYHYGEKVLHFEIIISFRKLVHIRCVFRWGSICGDRTVLKTEGVFRKSSGTAETGR